jgi:hypothetical protein
MSFKIDSAARAPATFVAPRFPTAADWEVVIDQIIGGEQVPGRQDIEASGLMGEQATRYNEEVDPERDVVQLFNFPYQGMTYTAVIVESFSGWTATIANDAGEIVAEEAGQNDWD